MRACVRLCQLEEFTYLIQHLRGYSKHINFNWTTVVKFLSRFVVCTSTVCCAGVQANSASYSQRNGEWISAYPVCAKRLHGAMFCKTCGNVHGLSCYS